MMMRWMIALALAFGGVACDSGNTTPAADSAQLTADQVVARHLAALGGVDKLKATRSLVVRGEFQEGSSVDTWVAYRARPNKLRKEGTHEGKPFIKLFDGDKGYISEHDGPFAAMPADKAAKMKFYAEFDDPLVDHAARGHKVALVGTEDVGGKKAHHLELTLANGDVEHRWLDATTFLDTQRKFTFKDKDGAQKTKIVRFSDWRDVNGLKFNFASEGEVDGKKHRTTIKSIEVDTAIDPGKFTAPANNTVAMAN
jgi:outer membrane lipoprotein-sorting protein